MLPPVLVTVPITESADQRKARESRKEPLPHISYVAHSVGGQGARKKGGNMLTDVVKVATQEWQEFTGRDLEILFKVSFETAKQAAEIAKQMGHIDVANEILERALHP